MKLSIIVPIYKVEQYLDKCVQSLLDQDIPATDYEIILVDDGSLDSCPVMCDAYAEQYANIYAIHRLNGGLSAARNTGIEVAQGDYIQFVDSDDFLQTNILGTLMEQVEREHLDVLRFNYRNINEDGEEIVRIPNPWGELEYSTAVCDGPTFLNTRLGYACYAWQFICKRGLIVSDSNSESVSERERKSKSERESESESEGQDCIFTEGILFEDTDWTPRLLVKANRVAETPTIVYNYMIRQNGITRGRSVEKLHKEINDKMAIITKLKLWNTICALDWYNGMITSLTISVLKVVASNLYEERSAVLERLRQIGVFPLHPYHLRKKTKVHTLLINMNSKLYLLMQHLK